MLTRVPSRRLGQLGHGTLEAELAPRLLGALQGLRMAEVLLVAGTPCV